MNQEIRQVKEESHSFDDILSKRLSEEGYEALASDWWVKTSVWGFFAHSLEARFFLESSSVTRVM